MTGSDDHRHAAHAPATPGVVLRRTTMLPLPFLLAGAALLGPAARLFAQDAPDALADGGPDAGELLLARWKELAAVLDAEPAAADAYLYRLRGLLAETAPDDLPRRMRVVFDRNGLVTGPAWFDGGLFVIELSLAPGAVIEPHNHPHLHVVTLAAEGSCRYEQYDPGPDAPAHTSHGEAFDVPRTGEGLPLPGRTIHLSRRRDNVHGFVAGPSGATLLDFNTRAADGRDGDFSKLVVEPTPADAEQRLFEARWAPNGY